MFCHDWFNCVSGDVFEGTYSNGRRSPGPGRLTLASGNVYNGAFGSDGRPDGNGAYEWNDGGPNHGDKYEGEYEAGQRTGKGRNIFCVHATSWLIALMQVNTPGPTGSGTRAIG